MLLRVHHFGAVKGALEMHIMTTEALNILVSLAAYTFVCVLNRCSSASYFFDNYGFS